MFTTWRTSTIPRRVCANNELLFISEVGMAWSTNRGTIKLHGNSYSSVHDNLDELVNCHSYDVHVYTHHSLLRIHKFMSIDVIRV